MAGTFALRVVSPQGNVLKDDVEFMVLPSEAGELGILPNHAPLIAGLNVGVMRYTKDGSTQRLAISGGFVEVADNQVTVLAETAEPGGMIDLARALAAKERAEKRLSMRTGEIDVRRAELALRKALARISAAEDEAKQH
ncbi:MAG: F0F1 ATP synthase subunit epsilon [Desulfitobacteriaceae bacterium]|nr:F0F1 ATP synthase subunit epsilon [Desulfitobacteriaceae bacterium]MDI6880423.1 F0F1 ATP synthase subunit epsilon [Desulfitobacteriaceae bacterium]MDI6915771.1 F0F1 ATP synthase subunit epsilon [Desulfitobacteriaceae bacterium]